MNLSLFFQNLSVMMLYFLASAALSLILSRLLIAVLPYFHLVDVPHGRHQHDHPVPRGGGLAIIFSFVIVMCAYMASPSVPFPFFRCPLLKQFLLPTLFITVLGVLDDRYELKSWIKLLGHILIGVYFYFSGAAINSILKCALPAWLALPVTVCWVIGIINAFNLIDGMDGVAAGLAMISAFSMALWSSIAGYPLWLAGSLLIFCGSCLGFLHFNFAPARIFMGDTGSMFIGMFFAYISIIGAGKAMTLTSLLVPVLAMGIPLFDVFLAISRRLYRRYIEHDKSVGIMTGDHDHLHHRMLSKMKNTRKAAVCLYALAVLLVAGAMGAALLDNVLQTLSFGILLLVLFVVIRFATIEFYDAASLIANGIRRPHRKFLLTAIHPLFDIFNLLIAYLLISALYRSDLFFQPFSLQAILCCIAPYPVVLSISGIYHTYWLRTNIARFNRLLQMLLISALLAMGLLLGLYLSQNSVDHTKILKMEQFFITFALTGGCFIMLERFLLHYAEAFWFQKMATSLAEMKKPLPRTLLYGGGLYCRMFLVSQHNACQGGKISRKVIGIIDDNPSLRHLNIFGMDVLGNCDDLDMLLEKYRFNEIIITLRDIAPKTREHLIDFGKKHDIRVQEFRCRLEKYTDFTISK